LLHWNRVGCWKGVFERVVERLFLAPARALGAIIFMGVAFRTGIHFDFSNRGARKRTSRRPTAMRCGCDSSAGFADNR
jgi:hypothetical protein